MLEVIYKKKWNNDPKTMERVRHMRQLHRDGKSNLQIAKQLGVSNETVRRYMRHMNLPYNRVYPLRNYASKPSAELKAPPPKFVDWLTVCRNALGKRLEIKPLRGEIAYYVDGLMRPVTQVIDVANAELIGNGMKPIGRKNGSYV